MEMTKLKQKTDENPHPSSQSPLMGGEESANAKASTPPSSSHSRPQESVPLVESGASVSPIIVNDQAPLQPLLASPGLGALNSNNSNNRNIPPVKNTYPSTKTPGMNMSPFVTQLPVNSLAPINARAQSKPSGPHSNIDNYRGMTNNAQYVPCPSVPAGRPPPPYQSQLPRSRHPNFNNPNSPYMTGSSNAPFATNPRLPMKQIPHGDTVPPTRQNVTRPPINPFQFNTEGKPTNPVQPIRRNSSEEIPFPRPGSSIKKHQSFAGHDRMVKPPVPKKSLRAQSFAIRSQPPITPRRVPPKTQHIAPL